MAKIYGLFGSMQGKVADVVMAVRNGEQIVRKYQPVVSNPSTPAQVESRAKLKLLSQLSAVMAPVIAIPRQGAVSARNFFVKLNYGATSYSSDTATVNLTQVKITKSVVGLPVLNVTRVEGGTLSLALYPSPQQVFDRVVYAIFHRTDTNDLVYDGSRTVDTPGESNTYPASFALSSSANTQVVFAYGVRDNTEAARAKFAEMNVPTAEMIANLLVTRSLTEADVTLTETQVQIVPVSA